MTAFATAYLIVWLAVVLYLARLEVRQRRLARNLDALESQLTRAENREAQVSRAA